MTDHVANSRCRANHEWQQERAITGRVGADKARRAEQDPRKAARADMTLPSRGSAPLADSAGLAQRRAQRLEGRRRVHAEDDLGLVVLSNLDGTDLPEALMYSLYDLYHAAREGLYRRLPRRCPGRGA